MGTKTNLSLQYRYGYFRANSRAKLRGNTDLPGAPLLAHRGLDDLHNIHNAEHLSRILGHDRQVQVPVLAHLSIFSRTRYDTSTDGGDVVRVSKSCPCHVKVKVNVTVDLFVVGV